MFYFGSEPKAVNISGIYFGGQTSEYPTVLVGGIKKIKPGTAEAIRQMEEAGEKTGLPGLVDIFLHTIDRLQERVDFVLDNTDKPFFIDLPMGQLDLKERILDYAVQKGCIDRIIYNSINYKTSEEEAVLLKNAGVKHAIILALDIANPATDGSINLLEEQLPLVKSAGIENLLVDPGTMPFKYNQAGVAGEVLRSITAIKQEFALPVGCAPINLVESWPYMKEKKKAKSPAYYACLGAVNAAAQIMGADFIIYGNVQDAENVFDSAAVINMQISEAMDQAFGVKPKTNVHPRCLL